MPRVERVPLVKGRSGVIGQLTRRMKQLAAAGLAGMTLAAGAAAAPEREQAEKVLQLPIRTDGPKTLDPVQGSTQYDNMACSQIYETLMENCYYDPRSYEPRLLESEPTRSEDGRTLTFKLKSGIRFHDDPCFPGGKGREITTDDVFYSLKRLADEKYELENWWLMADTIVGFDAFKDEQNAAATFNYDAPVEGFKKINDKEFQIVLTKPVHAFIYKLSQFQTSIVPREAVERYGQDFGLTHAVGTGPFVLREFTPKQKLIVVKNPSYHDVRYPAADRWSSDDRRMRMHRAAGQKAPFVDRIEFTMYVEDQPMWLQFEAGNLAYTEVPAEYFELAFNKRTKQLLPTWTERGVRGHSDLLLDFIFRGFNMEDPLLGGYTPEKRALRQAISLAMNLDEFNEAFYNGLNHVYDGPIPPGLDGYPEGGRAPVSYRGPNLERARQKLAEAGYPNGQGLPPIRYYTSRGGNNGPQTELMTRQLRAVGITLDAQLVDFSTLIEYVNNKKAPMFSFAWASDYPDAENNLALFYGPNEAPGSNHYNYKRADYDAMYNQIVSMEPGPERTEMYIRMRDMIIEDCPYVGSMARTRYYLVAPWAENLRPTERYWGWFKFVDVDDAKRPGR